MGMIAPAISPAGIRNLSIPAEGATLAAQLYLPQGTPRAAAVMHGATGVPMGYYREFAGWLAKKRGVATLLYDYRDFGASARGPVRRAEASMIDWGLLDQRAALQTLTRLFPATPRWVIGQSLGGLFLAFHPEMAGVDRVIAVNSGPVHISDHPTAFRQLARAFWHGPHHALSLALGYHPGKSTGLGADLPLGVWRDWRRWCTTRGFYLPELGQRLPFPDPSRVTARLRLITTTDDPWVPQAAVWRLMQLYPEAIKQQRVLNPADFGLSRLGHLGALARTNAAVWPSLVD